MILVTGCSGFIGKNLVEHLCHNLKLDVIGIDKVVMQTWNLQHNVDSHFVFRKVDLTVYKDLVQIFKEYPIRKIVHLAAESHVDRSISSAAHFWKNNVNGTANLMEVVHECSDHVELIINQITDEVYGPKPEGEAIEGDKFLPTNPYAGSKAAQYLIGKTAHITYGLPVVSTFPVNNFGRHQAIEKLIPKFVRYMKDEFLKETKVPLMASTHFERDWLPVIDMCRAHALLLDKGVPGEDYNIGADNHRTNKQITEKLLSLTGWDWDDKVKIVKDRLAHDSRYAVNSDRIKALGWSVQEDFDEYLEQYVQEFKCE